MDCASLRSAFLSQGIIRDAYNAIVKIPYGKYEVCLFSELPTSKRFFFLEKECNFQSSEFLLHERLLAKIMSSIRFPRKKFRATITVVVYSCGK